jgi:hypothetical protein
MTSLAQGRGYVRANQRPRCKPWPQVRSVGSCEGFGPDYGTKGGTRASQVTTIGTAWRCQVRSRMSSIVWGSPARSAPTAKGPFDRDKIA